MASPWSHQAGKRQRCPIAGITSVRPGSALTQSFSQADVWQVKETKTARTLAPARLPGLGALIGPDLPSGDRDLARRILNSTRQ